MKLFLTLFAIFLLLLVLAPLWLRALRRSLRDRADACFDAADEHTEL